jgi:hypothetical protein
MKTEKEIMENLAITKKNLVRNHGLAVEAEGSL